MIQGKDIANYLAGNPVFVQECGIVITQPKIKNICLFGEDEFLAAAQLIGNIDKVVAPMKEGNPQLADYSDFQILLTLALQDPSVKQNIDIFFELIFPENVVEITETAMVFRKKEDESQVVGMINPFTFEAFSERIKDIFLIKDTGNKIEYNPGNEKAKEIMEKIERGRKRVAAQKQGDGIGSLFATYTSTLSIGMNIDINILFNYTPFQLYDAFNRYWLKVQSDFYTKVSTTPLMDVSKMKKPAEWSANLYK